MLVNFYHFPRDWGENKNFSKPPPTLPETNIAMENPPFLWYLPGKDGIFMGYVSFRDLVLMINHQPTESLKIPH